MPIENERKFTLLESDSVESVIKDAAERCIHIEQKYLVAEKGFSVRVRHLEEQGENSYRLTVKKDVNEQTIEIETPISLEDFEPLWFVASGKVVKNRYIYQGWEVDFFKDEGENYFAIAEIEMPPNQKAPDTIPELLKSYIIYTVPFGDGRFSNKRLGDIGHAKKLMREVKEMVGRDSRHSIAEAYFSGRKSVEPDQTRLRRRR